jgi:Mg2+/Co2+ transporter CorC
LIKEEHITKELKAQYDIFYKMCGKADYWNTHQNSGLDFKTFPIFNKVALELGINKTRTFQRTYIKGGAYPVSLKGRFIEFAKRQVFNIWFGHLIPKTGTKVPDGRMIYFDDTEKTKDIKNIGENILWGKKNVVEMVVHPAIVAQYKYFGTLTETRLAEWKMFSSNETEPSITEDELTEIIETAEEEGVVDEEQSDMLKSAIEFTKTTVGDIMTMEKDMNCIVVNWTNKQVLDFITNTVHSRLPVKAANSDRIIGVLRVRTFLKEYRRNPRIEVRSVMTAPYVIRDNTKIDTLLTHMRQHKLQMAIVQDEKRKLVGIVTLEDILEELVGELFDEEDIVDTNFQALGGNKYMVNTHMVISEIYDRMGLGKAARGIANKPLLSLILETLGRVPSEDEEAFLYENLEITPKTVENGRLTEVVIHILDDEEIAAYKADELGEEVKA